MSDENYTEAQSFEASHEAVEQETAEALADGTAAVLPAYSSVENRLELGVLDGLGEIRAFLKNL